LKATNVQDAATNGFLEAQSTLPSARNASHLTGISQKKLEDDHDLRLMIMKTPNAILITDWLTAIGTIGTVIVALFLSVIRKWYMRPKFEIEFANQEPFCKHAYTEILDSKGVKRKAQTFWIRLRVWNKGRSIARGCEGKLVRITQESDKQDRTDFDPVVLHWVGTSHGPPHPIDINRGESEYLDIVYTIQELPDRYVIPADEIEPRAINLFPPRQDYVFHVVLYGANVKPLPRDLHLKSDIQFDKIRLEQIS
jgi:hypothetical protein